ncbi:MAG: helix-turn-helix transcriptional regulator [Clostridia bacterium]|nr:helix-turn-helix transcriptional regulator [Clostridia bacterium]
MKTEKNIYTDIGRRIRERRKKLGLTQTQLSGEYMTRNMLSRIETGDAHPSLDTLLYIAQKLKMPPSFFLCRDALEEAEYTKAVKVKEARRSLGMGQYKKCIDTCSELPAEDDEIAALKAASEVMLALSFFDKGELKEAHVHLERASGAMHSTVYLYSEMLSQIKLISTLAQSLAKGAPPSPKDIPPSVPIFFTKDRYLYILALSLREGGNALCEAISDDSPYKAHLLARALMEKGEYIEASQILDGVFNSAPECFSAYFSLLDLEKCCSEAEDYKTAYRLAEIRAELHDRYNA